VDPVAGNHGASASTSAGPRRTGDGVQLDGDLHSGPHPQPADQRRRFQDFATLAPAVQALVETRGQLSFSDSAGSYQLMVDGTDYNEPFLGDPWWRSIRTGFTIRSKAPFRNFRRFHRLHAGAMGARREVFSMSSRSPAANGFHGQAFLPLTGPTDLGAADPLGFQSLERQHQFWRQE